MTAKKAARKRFEAKKEPWYKRHRKVLLTAAWVLVAFAVVVGARWCH